MPDSKLEAACRFFTKLNMTLQIRNTRLVFLVLIFFLMLVQDALFKAAVGFPVTSIEPCEDTARGGDVFFLIRWVPIEHNSANMTSCLDGAEIMRQSRDSALVSLAADDSVTLPTNASFVLAQPAFDLLEEYSDSGGLRFMWGLATLVGPVLWVLAELVAVLLPRLFDQRFKEGRVDMVNYLLVDCLCFTMSMVCNFMLIVNTAVQWHEAHQIFAATMTMTELGVHTAAAASLMVCFVLVVTLVGAFAFGACCFRQCPCLCRCFLGADDREAAIQGLVCRLTLVSGLITLIGVLLKSVSLVAHADEYGDLGHQLLDNYHAILHNVSWSEWSPSSFLDQPSLSADFIGDYLLYQRRERPTELSMLDAYSSLRSTISVLLGVEVGLTCLASATAIGAVLLQCSLCCCQAVHGKGNPRIRV